MIKNTSITKSILLFLLVELLVSCSVLPRTPVPVELMPLAEIPDMPNIRASAGRPSSVFEADLLQSYKNETQQPYRDASGKLTYSHLALSGGGPQGAFGAGFLAGWSQTGTRPVFKIVSGVSTGALIAPFAFLGQSYDQALHNFYTTNTTQDIFERNNLWFHFFFRESLADTSPLTKLIDQHVTPELLKEIANAHHAGRRLYVGTVDLDSQTFIVWNMGLIASKNTPASLKLFRKVMLASSSIPVAFPPVLFDVVANGKYYDEMHMDGAVAARVFYNAGVFSSNKVRQQAGLFNSQENIYVIHNGQLNPEPQPTPRLVRSIAMRTFDSSGKAAVVGDLYRIYAVSRSENASFHWITIPSNVKVSGTEIFDPVEMESLYQAGYTEALRGPDWSVRPPGSDAFQPRVKSFNTN